MMSFKKNVCRRLYGAGSQNMWFKNIISGVGSVYSVCIVYFRSNMEIFLIDALSVTVVYRTYVCLL